jgi:hypothetical protein
MEGDNSQDDSTNCCAFLLRIVQISFIAKKMTDKLNLYDDFSQCKIKLSIANHQLIQAKLLL